MTRDLKTMRTYCQFDGNRHLWTFQYWGSGRKTIHCARCFSCLGTEELLAVYIEAGYGDRLT